ncbi:hypothetical protein DUI87_31543 [Hirundo rustica rustica]|uniref:Uncharacterized protein n=1 Tax=Hirundo rustica rustica TaxID=333673 RepID=A0A3M0IT52_HIRRU|nr:hypothetical protein DUI87_31543 [Hirundo rustica rustica]
MRIKVFVDVTSESGHWGHQKNSKHLFKVKNFGKCHSEISNASDYLTRCYSHEDRYLEKIPHVYAPLSDLPQDLYPHHSDISFRCPPPGSRAPYICPKEQDTSVINQHLPFSWRAARSNLSLILENKTRAGNGKNKEKLLMPQP